MLAIPLYVFFFIYLAFLIFYFSFALIDIGHLVRTGALTGVSFVFAFIFIALTILILGLTWGFLAGTAWQQPVIIWNNAWLGIGGGALGF